MLIVPYAEPVEKDIIAPRINIKLGNKNAGIAPFNASTKYSAAPNSFITDPNDQANIRITAVIIRPFIPSIHTSIASLIVNIFFHTAITIATTVENIADCNNAIDASDAAKTSNIALNDNGEFVTIALIAISSPAIIDEYPL